MRDAAVLPTGSVGHAVREDDIRVGDGEGTKTAMLSRIAAWMRRRRQQRADRERRGEHAAKALAAARSAFAVAYPDRPLLGNWCYVDAVDDGHIVTLLSPTARPPMRSWWQVSAAGDAVEIDHHAAACQIKIPVWR